MKPISSCNALVENEGRTVLNDFFAWLVENTKQTNRFHAGAGVGHDVIMRTTLHNLIEFQ